jgi:SAM-dependent methyltransferase
MMLTTDPRGKFWDSKIVEWEDSRYQGAEHAHSLLEKFSTYMSGSLRVRLEECAKLLMPRVKGKAILELGCGSGLMASRLMAAGAASYHGIDISAIALERARQRGEEEGYAERQTFVAGDALSLPLPHFDLVIGLGFLDWISKQQIAQLAKRIAPAPWLFTFSEKRFSLLRLGHRLYTRIAYGRGNGGYVPDYYTEEEVRSFFSPAGYGKLTFIRDPRMSFGVIVHCLG